jgi:hypothetical protein
MRRTWPVWAVLSCLALAAPAAARDAYFAVVFGAQRPYIKVPRYSHSFASFLHLRADGVLEAFSISWLPRTGEIRPLWLEPEEGRNYTLPETLRFCEENRMVTARWGPYQVQPDLWNRALWQKARLESGQVLYQAFDGGSLDGQVSNCLHAISSLAQRPGERLPKVIVAPANWGESGSYWIALTLRPWYIDPCRTYDCLLARLGVDPNAICLNGLDRNPTPNPATAAVQAALHLELLPNRVHCGR